LQSADADACNLLVAIVVETRCWMRYGLHTLAYGHFRDTTPLGLQCWTVTPAYKVVRSNGEIGKAKPVPMINFRRASVHPDKRTFAIDQTSPYTLSGRVTQPQGG
jgi:hypothetical protein